MAQPLRGGGKGRATKNFFRSSKEKWKKIAASLMIIV